MKSTVIPKWSLFLLLTICTVPSTESANFSCPKKCQCFPSTIDQQSNINLKCVKLKNSYQFLSSVEQATRVVSIQATNANIFRIHIIYSQCENLKRLDLSDNKISSLENFPNFPKLTDLNLSGNIIFELNGFLFPQSLVHVNFSHNLIPVLPLSLTKLKSLKSFDVTNNPIICSDCHTLLVRNWLIQNNIEGHSAVKCMYSGSNTLSWLDVQMSNLCITNFDTRYRRSINDDLIFHDDVLDSSGDDANEIVRIQLTGQGIEFDASGDGDHDMELFIPVTSSPSTSELKPIENNANDDDFHFDDLHEIVTMTEGNFSETYEDGSGSGDDSLIIGQTLTSTEFFGSGDVSFSTTESFLTTTTEDDMGSGLGFSSEISDWDYDDDKDNNDTSFDNDMISHHNINEKESQVGEDTSTPAATTALLQPVTEEILKRAGVARTNMAKISEAKATEELNENSSTTEGKDKSAIAVEQQSNKQPLGTYIFLAILIAVLICLMGYAIIKSNLRNRKRNRASDTEKAEVEMGDMTKTPLVPNDSEDPVKVNGKPETIPLSPSDEPQDKLADEPEHLGQEVANELSLSPTNGITTPTPVTPETERVKIRVSELPDSVLKTPVLVTRTRSNAGDFIVTPNETPSSHN